MEHSIGRSILSIIAGTQAEWMRSMTVDFTAYGLKYGLQGMPDKFDPYKVIEDAFEQGMELNELTGYILLAIEQTGLFQIRTPEPTTAKTGETETEKK